MASKIPERVSSIPLSGIRKIMEYAKGLTDVIFLNIGEPDFATPENIREAAKKAINEGFTHYTSIQGIPELRQAIAQKLEAENGIRADPEREILVTAGAQPAFFALCQTLIDRGDEVIVQDPFFPSYEVALRLAGARIVAVPLRQEREFIIDPEDLEAKITKKTKLLVLISPNNPTGSVIDKKTLKTISQIAEDHDLIVVSDELYEKMTYDGIENCSVGSFPGMKERTITINGFSKAYAMTGWRVGYIVASEDLMENISKVHHSMNTCASSISQKAALAALTGPQNFVEKMVEEYGRRRLEMVRRVNEIPGFKCHVPKGAFYVFPNVESLRMPSMDLAKLLITKARVVTVPGSEFGNNGEGFLRLSYATSIEKISEALVRIKEVVEAL